MKLPWILLIVLCSCGTPVSFSPSLRYVNEPAPPQNRIAFRQTSFYPQYTGIDTTITGTVTLYQSIHQSNQYTIRFSGLSMNPSIPNTGIRVRDSNHQMIYSQVLNFQGGNKNITLETAYPVESVELYSLSNPRLVYGSVLFLPLL